MLHYYYLDESGNIVWPTDNMNNIVFPLNVNERGRITLPKRYYTTKQGKKEREKLRPHETHMVLAFLEIWGKKHKVSNKGKTKELEKSKSWYKIRRAVRETLRDFQDHLRVCHGWPEEIKIAELKGSDPYRSKFEQAKKQGKSLENLRLEPERGKGKLKKIPGLSSHPDIWSRFFARIAKAEQLKVYIIYCDKRALKEKPPKDLGERYVNLLRNLIPSLQTPPKIMLIIADKRNMKKDTERAFWEKMGEKESSKRQKGKDQKMKELGKEWHKQFNQMIGDTIRKKFQQSGIKIPKIWHKDSKEDAIIQAADSIAYFSYSYKYLGLDLPPNKASKEEREKNKKRKRWFKLYQILEGKEKIIWIPVDRLGKYREEI